jgi:HAD superfamily hydrolase (TIGR01549 family)
MRWSHYYWAQSPEFHADRESHQDDDEAFWTTFASRYLSAYGCSQEQARQLAPKMNAFMSQEYQPEDWVPPEAFDTLRELKDAGYTLGLVSNRTDPAHEQLDALGLLPYLDFAFVAGEVEIWKPEAGIFHHAVELAGSSPERSIYVGDNYYADVVGASNAGLTPILLDPEGIFPDAECTVIRSLGDLSGVL